MTMTQLILVRHGESEGNLARDEAESARSELIPVDQRDPDVPLSDRGREQARAVGTWLGQLSADERPVVAWSSPYVRAVQTTQLALAEGGPALDVDIDERLRDRELGILDRLTARGVAARFPEEAQRRRYLGKLYYRPPGGESWADVALRLRSFLRDVEQQAGDGSALIVCHDAVVLLFRYVLERLTESELLDIAASGSLVNASVTTLRRAPGDRIWRIGEFNQHAHLAEQGVTATQSGGEHDVHPR